MSYLKQNLGFLLATFGFEPGTNSQVMIPFTNATNKDSSLSVIDLRIITYTCRARQLLHIPLKANDLQSFSFAILDKSVQLRAMVYTHTPDAVIKLCINIQNSKGSH